MARTTYSDPAVCDLIERSYVPVRVDAERRPDIGERYALGGWPTTAFLTPDGVPYYGGTYFPSEPRHGMPSFRQVLAAAADAYGSRRDEVTQAGAQLTEVLDRSATEPQPSSGRLEPGDTRIFAHAVSAAGRTFDPSNGGFGGAPKFPQPDFLDFLLRTGGPESHGASMAVHTLSRMAAGGIRDHCGGGFHRYSVDARWLVPHFEKMLYDNALIARALVRAHLLGARHLGPVAEETLDYVLEDLASPEGVFRSARDADSEGEEGAFYLWTPGEVRDVLGADAARLVSRVYDVSDAGNFEGRNILHLPHDLDAVARQEGMPRGELDRMLRDSLDALKARRATRPEPLRDDKVLTSWNGFTIRALAEAGPALGRPDYTGAAAGAAGFLLDTVRRGDRLMRVFAGGRVHVDGFLEDYGALGNACLTLYEATLDGRWLGHAEWIAEAAVAHFWSPAERLFHDAPADGEALLVRPRDIMDNATPSGNSLAVELLVRSAALTGSAQHREIAEAVLARERGTMERYPSAVGRLLAAALTHETPRLEITLVGPPERVADKLGRAHRHSHPNRLVAGGDPEDAAVAGLPAMEGRLDRPGEAFVCLGSACQEPAPTPAALDAALARAQSV